MFLKNKNIIIGILILLAFTIASISITLIVANDTYMSAISVYKYREYVRESESAFIAYKSNENVGLKLFAFEHFIGYCEEYCDSDEILASVSKSDMALAYGYSGELYEKQGDNVKAESYYKHSIEIINGSNLFERWRAREVEIDNVANLKRFLNYYSKEIMSEGE
jgi:tetratricopeptide (TPR) repeat protein